MIFSTTDITDQSQLDGIEHALAKYNAGNPQNQLKNAQAFFEWFTGSQFAQWAQQKADVDVAQIIDVIRDPAVLAKAKAAVQEDIDAKEKIDPVVIVKINPAGIAKSEI